MLTNIHIQEFLILSHFSPFSLAYKQQGFFFLLILLLQVDTKIYSLMVLGFFFSLNPNKVVLKLSSESFKVFISILRNLRP